MIKKYLYEVKRIIFIISELSRCCFGVVSSFLTGGESCVSCGKKVLLIPLCKTCRKKLFNNEIKNSCHICGKELVSEIEICSACRTSPVVKSADRVYPAVTYRLWKKQLLFSWKMQEKRFLGFVFASLIKEKLSKLNNGNFNDVYVVPVPPRPGKIKEKGWDQVDDVCKYLYYFYRINVLKVLKRVSKVQQKKLDRTQRLETIGNAYTFAGGLNENISLPSKFFLFDDVLTTGSTIEHCSSLLKQNGFKEVFAITVFVVD